MEIGMEESVCWCVLCTCAERRWMMCEETWSCARGDVLCWVWACCDVQQLVRMSILALCRLCRMGLRCGSGTFGVLVMSRVTRAGACALGVLGVRGAQAGDAAQPRALCSMLCAPPVEVFFWQHQTLVRVPSMRYEYYDC